MVLEQNIEERIDDILRWLEEIYNILVHILDVLKSLEKALRELSRGG